MDVRTTTGRYIGTVRDIMIDPHTSAVAFFLISGGRLPSASETVRLAPAPSIGPSSFDTGLSTTLSEFDWQSLPTVTALASRETRLSGHVAADDRANKFRNEDGAAKGGRLVRGAELRGQWASTPGGSRGRIADILVDFRHGTAVAVISDKPGKRDYALPIDELDLQHAASDSPAAPRERESSKSESRSAPSAAHVATSDALQPRGDPPLSPTGRARDTPGRDFDGDSVLQAAARAVRKGWDADPSLTGLDLHVRSENGRLVVSGTVPSAAAANRARAAARAAAGPTPIVERVLIAGEVR